MIKIREVLDKLTGFPSQAEEIFGKRAFLAWEIVKKWGVKQYIFKDEKKTLWLVTGEGTYEVMPHFGYCACFDHLFTSMSPRPEQPCKHLIAWKLAYLRNWFDIIEVSDKSIADERVEDIVLITHGN